MRILLRRFKQKLLILKVNFISQYFKNRKTTYLFVNQDIICILVISEENFLTIEKFL